MTAPCSRSAISWCTTARRSWLSGGGKTVYAVNGVSFEVGSRRDARPGRRIRLREVHRRPRRPPAHPPHRRRGAFRGPGRARRSIGARSARLRRRMQIVFQDPYSSLNPAACTIGASVAEGIEIHRLVPRREIPARVGALLEEVGLDPSYGEPLSPRVLGRPAAADRHRPRARGRARVPGLRRAGLGARRLGAGPGPEPAPRPPAPPRARLPLHRARPRRRAADRPSRRGDVLSGGSWSSARRRDRHHPAPSPVHHRAALRRAGPDPERQRIRIVLPGDPPSPTVLPPGCPFAGRCFHPAKDARCIAEAPGASGRGRAAKSRATTPNSPPLATWTAALALSSGSSTPSPTRPSAATPPRSACSTGHGPMPGCERSPRK